MEERHYTDLKARFGPRLSAGYGPPVLYHNFHEATEMARAERAEFKLVWLAFGTALNNVYADSFDQEGGDVKPSLDAALETAWENVAKIVDGWPRWQWQTTVYTEDDSRKWLEMKDGPSPTKFMETTLSAEERARLGLLPWRDRWEIYKELPGRFKTFRIRGRLHTAWILDMAI